MPLLVGVYLLLLFVKVWWAVDQPTPTVVDELGYLGNARYFATGEGLVDDEGRAAYKVGYSLFLTPAFLLTEDPELAYRYAVVLGALLSSFLFPLLYVLLSGLRPAMPTVDRGGIALIGALTPGACAYGQTAMSFNLLSVGVAGLAILALRLDRLLAASDEGIGRHLGQGLALGVLLGALYSVHERAVGTLGITLLVLLAVVFVHRSRFRWWPFVGFVSAMVPIVVWSKVKGIPGANYSSVERTRWVFSIIPGWADPLVEAVGQLWYLSIASGAVLAVLIAVVVLRPRRTFATLRQRPVFWSLMIGNLGALFAASTVYMSRAGTQKPTYLLYGRYNEGFLPLLLALGLCLVHTVHVRSCGRGRARATRGWLLIGGGAALLPLVAWVVLHTMRPEVFSARTSVFSTPALRTLTRQFGYDTGTLSLLLGLAAALLSLAFAWRFRAALAVLLVLMAWHAVAVEDFLTWHSLERDNQHVIAEVIEEIQPEGDIVSYDREIFPVFHYYAYDYLLPRHETRAVETGSLATAEGAFVITGSDDPEVAGEGAKLVVAETFGEYFESYRPHLWVRPGPEQDEIVRRGWYFPGHCLECLDPSTTRARLEIVEPTHAVLRMLPGAEARIRLRLGNAGASPWATRGMLKRKEKTVRIARTWKTAEGKPLVESRIDLERALMPGQSRELDLRVEASGADWHPLLPGRYRLEIRLVQEDGFWLEGDDGDAVAVLDVEIL